MDLTYSLSKLVRTVAPGHSGCFPWPPVFQLSCLIPQEFPGGTVSCFRGVLSFDISFNPCFVARLSRRLTGDLIVRPFISYLAVKSWKISV